jgi:hypothetical protein
MPLLAWPLTVTTTFPAVAPIGTGTSILVLLQLVGIAVVPLKVTVLVPCEVPKLFPERLMLVPTAAVTFVMLDMEGGGTVKVTPLLDWPPTVTTAAPLVAPAGMVVPIVVSLQLVAVAGRPLIVTVLVP